MEPELESIAVARPTTTAHVDLEAVVDEASAGTRNRSDAPDERVAPVATAQSAGDHGRCCPQPLTATGGTG